MKSQPIAERLAAAQILLTNALLPNIQPALVAYGYTPDRIATGKALYAVALAAQQKQVSEYGEQYEATAAQERAFATANQTYMRFIKVARIACKDDLALWQGLGLNGERKKSLSGWLLQAGQFYSYALSSSVVQSRLALFGITPTTLQQGETERQALLTANTLQAKEKGEAQQATQERDRILDILDDWLEDFRNIARLALDDQPQLLESLGIIVAS